MKKTQSKMTYDSENSSKRLSLSKRNIVRAKFNDITTEYDFNKKPIGKGGYGEVYHARHKQTGLSRAIKHIKLPKNMSDLFEEGKLPIDSRLGSHEFVPGNRNADFGGSSAHCQHPRVLSLQ